MSNKQKILMVEDDQYLGLIVKECFETRGFEVTWCQDGLKGQQSYESDPPSICIFDVMMPEKDGFSLAEEIRKTDKETPIVFLTARSMTEDVIKGCSIGAHDYVKKPFSMEELIARVQAILERTNGSSPILSGADRHIFQLGQYSFDYEKQTLSFDSDIKNLTPREAELLKMLCENTNSIVDRKAILKKIWGDDSFFNGRSLDVFMTKIRKYLKKDENLRIINLRGEGYKFVVLEG